MLGVTQKRKYEEGVYMWITRHTVLGKWHEIKLREWEYFQEHLICNCKEENVGI